MRSTRHTKLCGFWGKLLDHLPFNHHPHFYNNAMNDIDSYDTGILDMIDDANDIIILKTPQIYKAHY